MFGYKKRIEKRIKDLEHQAKVVKLRQDNFRSELNCLKGKHDYELKEVGVGLGEKKMGDFGGIWTRYDKYRPAKVCKHCTDTINFEEVKED